MGMKYLLKKADLAINGQDGGDAAELADEILALDTENEEAMLVKAEALNSEGVLKVIERLLVIGRMKVRRYARCP